jgi:hypothetical protein
VSLITKQITNTQSYSKFRICLGFCWGFLKRTQNKVISDHDQKPLKLDVCSGLESDLHPKEIPNTNHNSRNQRLSQHSKGEEQGREQRQNRIKKLQQPQT